MIQIHYGFGKGKTSNLNGSAIRAKGAGFNPVIYRFLKGRHTSEDKLLESLKIGVNRVHFGDKFVMNMDESEKQELKKIILEALDEIRNSKANVLLLDEIIDLVKVEMLTEDELVSFIKEINNEDREIIITGHYELNKLFDIADLITKYDAEKHYFEKGVKAREGFEY